MCPGQLTQAIGFGYKHIQLVRLIQFNEIALSIIVNPASSVDASPANTM